MHCNSPLIIVQHFIHAHMEQRNLEDAVACLTDTIEWFGTGVLEIVHGKEEARQFLMREITTFPMGYQVVFEDMSETMLTENVGTVLGQLLITDRAMGSELHCRVTATCVRQNESFLLASLHMSLPTALQNDSEYYPFSIAAKKIEEIRNSFFNVTLPGGLVSCKISEGFPVHYVNDFLAKLLGYSNKTDFLSSIGGLFVNCFGEGEDIASMTQEVQTMRIGGHHTFTYRLKTKSGKELWFRGYTYKYEDNGYTSILCFCMDISDIICLEDELKEQKNQLEFASAEMQTIISNIPGGVHRCQLFDKVRVDYVSHGFEELSGYTQEEIHTIFHDNYSLMLVEEDRDVFREKVCLLCHSPIRCILEYRMQRKDGSIIRVVDHFRSVRMEDGRMWGFGVATDVTAQHETLAQLQLLTDSIPGGLVVYESAPNKTDLVYFSDGVCAMVGYTRKEYAEIAKIDIANFVVVEDLPLLHSKISRLVKGFNTIDCVYRHRTKKGGFRWLNLRGTVSDRFGDMIRVNAVLLDITESKEAEDKLRIRDEEYRLAIQQSGKLVYRYTIADKSIYMLQKATDFLDFPASADNIPESIIAHNLLTPESTKDLLSFHSAIENGEKTGCITLCRKLGNSAFGWYRTHFTTLFDSTGTPISAIISIENVTRQYEQELENEKLRQNEELFQVVVSHSDRYIIKYDIKNRIAILQPSTAKAFSVEAVQHNVPDCYIGQDWLAKESEQITINFYQKLIRGTPTAKAIIKMKINKKLWGWYRFDGNVIFDEQNCPSYAVISFVDITKQYEKELAFERINQHVNQLSKEAVLHIKANLTTVKITDVGGLGLPCISNILEGDPLELLNTAIKELIMPKDSDAIHEFFSRDCMLADFANGKTEKEIQVPILCCGHPKWVSITVELVADPYTEDVLVYVLFQDINQTKMKEIDMLKQAETDGLTDLYNRTALKKRIKKVLMTKQDTPCAFIMIDVDDLKIINDTLGHIQGDLTIQSFANVLRTHFGPDALIGRVGGDEFLVFLQDIKCMQKFKDTLHALVNRLSALHVGENEDYPLHGSIGASVSHSTEDTFDILYKQADMALYDVKRHGKNNYMIYTFPPII
ncbi:MAG: diguanylate cyclase [Lachnospiraceae bacterium]